MLIYPGIQPLVSSDTMLIILLPNTQKLAQNKITLSTKITSK
jgi:hypothetical protein